MSNDYYNNDTPLTPGTTARASDLNSERDALEAAFDKLPTEVETGHVKGVTSPIQTQLDTLDSEKAPKASPTFTGVPAAPTAAEGTSTTQIATTEFVARQAFNAVDLPGQTGNAGKYLQTDGTSPVWSDLPANNMDYQEFTESGTWTKPAGALVVFVEVISGGDGGDGGDVLVEDGINSALTPSYAGGAAGLKGVRRAAMLFRAVDLPSSAPVVVGAGGNGGAGASHVDSSFTSSNGAITAGGAGGAGGDSYFLSNDFLRSNADIPSLDAVIGCPIGGGDAGVINIFNYDISDSPADGQDGKCFDGSVTLPKGGGSVVNSSEITSGTVTLTAFNGEHSVTPFCSGAGGGSTGAELFIRLSSGTTVNMTAGNGGNGGIGSGGGGGGIAFLAIPSSSQNEWDISAYPSVSLHAGDGGDGGDGIVRVWTLVEA